MNVSLKGDIGSFGPYKVITCINNPLKQLSPGMAWFDENCRPTVFIFDESLKGEELKYVLAHEAAHIANRDLENPLIDFHKLKTLGNEGYLSYILSDPEYRRTVEEEEEASIRMELSADKAAYELFGFDKTIAAEYLEETSLRHLGYMHEHISARINAIRDF